MTTRYISDYAWGADVERILQQYTEDPDAILATMAVLNMFKNAENAVVGKPSVQGTLSLMMDMTTNLPLNPFWQKHGPEIMADVASRWRDWMRSLMVVQQEGAEISKNDIASFRASALRSSFISLADYVLLYGPQDKMSTYMERTTKLHAELATALE